MSDDLHIPAAGPGRAPMHASYRSRRARAEPDMRLLTFAAAGLGLLLLLGMGGYVLMGRHPGRVPVIEADSRPLRVKPDNPGGMQVSTADEALLGDGAGSVEAIGPAPEAPAPQALRAQMQPPAPAAAPPDGSAVPASPAAAPGNGSAPAAASPPAPAGGSAGRVGGSPLPDTPARPPSAPRAVAAAPSPTAAGPAVPATGAAAGSAQVQLAAVESEGAAQAEWQRLSHRMPELLRERRPAIQKAEVGGRPVYRLRLGGFADTAEATGFCVKVKARGGACTLASF